MNSQTTRRPEDKPTTTRSSRAKSYKKQTATYVEARRDGTPLIFNWGGHLTRNQKTAIQRLAIWTGIGIIALAVVAVFVGFWVNFNIVVPNEPIVTFMGQGIPQSDYHKLVALKGQMEENKLKGRNGLEAQLDTLNQETATKLQAKNTAQTNVDNLNKQIKALSSSQTSQKNTLEGQLSTAQTALTTATNDYNGVYTQAQTMKNTTIPNEENYFTQSQIGNDSGQWLQDDLLIRSWLNAQSTAIQNKINPSSTQVTQAIKSFKNNLPTSKIYSQFLSGFNVSDSDVQTMMVVVLRRQNMQTYQANQYTSPTKQYRIRGITVATQANGNQILQDLRNHSDFATLAKDKSLDTSSKTKGGELGWFAKGQYTVTLGNDLGATVDNWLFGSNHNVWDYSPVLLDNGTYHVFQVEEIDNSRAVDSSTQATLKSDALSIWTLSQLESRHIDYGTLDSNKLLDPSNMPAEIPSSPPATPTTTAAPGGTTGAPGTTSGTTSAPGN